MKLRPSLAHELGGWQDKEKLLLHALPPARGGHAAVQSVSDGQKRTVVLLQCSSTPSLFVFPKGRRAKRSPDACVADSCVE